MKLIGLTGGIGSGKSTVAQIFVTFGIPVYKSDEKAKSLMISNVEVRNEIIALLGTAAYTDHSSLNNSWIASQVFADRNKLEQLNAIVHPTVYADLVSWSKEKPQLDAPY